MKKCVNCNMEFQDEFLFCTQCGSNLIAIREEPKLKEEKVKKEKKVEKKWTIAFLSSQQEKSQRFLIKESFIVGREEGNLKITDDKTISPVHAKFYIEDDFLLVEDLDSLNGIYIKITAPYKLEFEDHFIVGEQILKISKPLQAESEYSPDAVPFLGSIVPEIYFLLEVKSAFGIEGEIYPVYKTPFSLGREDCDLNFPDDKFISRTHCLLEVKNSDVLLVDKESKNGTFVKIKKKIALKGGEIIFIGRQLFKIECSCRY